MSKGLGGQKMHSGHVRVLMLRDCSSWLGELGKGDGMKSLKA